MFIEKWLRKYDVKTGKYTNQCFPYSELMASEPCMRIVDAEEAEKCRIALLAEKKASVLANQRRLAEKPVVIPEINKVSIAPNSIEAQSVIPTDIQTPESVIASLESEVDSEPLQMPLDDLDGKTRDELRAIVDAEELPVKKNGTAESMLKDIRDARKAKSSGVAPVGMEAVKAQSDAAIESVKG